MADELKHKKRIRSKINKAVSLLTEALELTKKQYPDATYFIDPYAIHLLEFDILLRKSNAQPCERTKLILISSETFEFGAGDW